MCVAPSGLVFLLVNKKRRYEILPPTRTRCQCGCRYGGRCHLYGLSRNYIFAIVRNITHRDGVFVR